MAKNAPKTVELIQNPSMKMTEFDSVNVRMNTKGDAMIVSLSMFAGSLEEISFTPKGEKEEVTYGEIGSITLDETFDVGGVKCQFKVIKGQDGKKDRLAIRPVGYAGSAKKSKAKPSL
jgi:hypothetical protein